MRCQHFNMFDHSICYSTALLFFPPGNRNVGECGCVYLMKLWHVTSVICHVCWNNQNFGVGEGKHDPANIIMDVKIQPEGDASNQNNQINLNKETKIFFIVLILTFNFMSTLPSENSYTVKTNKILSKCYSM